MSAAAGHVASLRWQRRAGVLGRPASPTPSAPSVTLVQQPAATLPALLLEPETDLNRPLPSPGQAPLPPPTASAGGFALTGVPDIFSSARAAGRPVSRLASA